MCFVAPGSFGALSGRTDLRYIGGAEVQQVLLARELSRRGYDVSFVTLDHGQPDGVGHHGIRVFKMCALEDGLPGLRFVHPRWSSLWRAMRRADADVYYQRGAGAETGQVAAWCALWGRPMIFASASETNCTPSLPTLRSLRERVLYRWGLRRAAAVVCQTSVQRELFRRAFSVDARVIRSCAEAPADESRPADRRRSDAPARALWLGRFAPVKRFETVLELAERLPRVQFDVVGGRAGQADYADPLLARARLLPNVTLHGWLEHERVYAFYRAASLLLCTSIVEGFPNTFLEAWAHGVPTVSTVDPDGIIARERLGVSVAEVSGLEAAIRAFTSDAEGWLPCSRRCRAYFLENHTVRVAVDAYEQLLREVAARGAAAAAETRPLRATPGD